jgi:pimeloyl-ACP methyl ester carboxylesterase
VADLAAFIDAQDLGPVDLLGHSLGGMVVLRLALEHPEKVRSLILMDTAPGPIPMIPKDMREAGVQLARNLGMGKLAEVMRAGMERPGTLSPAHTACIAQMGPEVFFGRIQRKLEQMDVVAFEALGVLIGEHESVGDRLAEIAVPTLVMVGSEDKGFLSTSEELAAGIANATLEIIPGAAHSPQLENPVAWLSAVTEHLARVRGDG